jgi:peptide/nickel transport system substrate-binding protein
MLARSPPSAVAREPIHGGTLTAIIQPEPAILTAVWNTAAPTGVVTGAIFDGLVDYDANRNPVRALAESWQTAADGLTLTLHLRHGVLWHDGLKFTSADVKWTLQEV